MQDFINVLISHNHSDQKSEVKETYFEYKLKKIIKWAIFQESRGYLLKQPA